MGAKLVDCVPLDTLDWLGDAVEVSDDMPVLTALGDAVEVSGDVPVLTALLDTRDVAVEDAQLLSYEADAAAEFDAEPVDEFVEMGVTVLMADAVEHALEKAVAEPLALMLAAPEEEGAAGAVLLTLADAVEDVLRVDVGD